MENWDDKFRLNLSKLNGKNLFSYEYIINETTRTITRENLARNEDNASTLDESDFFINAAVHLGSA